MDSVPCIGIEFEAVKRLKGRLYLEPEIKIAEFNHGIEKRNCLCTLLQFEAFRKKQ